MPRLTVEFRGTRMLLEVAEGWTGQISLNLVNGMLSKRSQRKEEKAICTKCGGEIEFLPVWVTQGATACKE